MINGFSLDCTSFSFEMAMLKTLGLTAYTLVGFVMLRSGAVATYTMFLMSGGMIMPYI